MNPDDASTVDAPPAESIQRDLTGALPCVVCRYELRGLSITAVCPECGTAVRATLLAVIDPLADELQPIRRRWLVAGGLVVWSMSALLAAVVIWYFVASWAVAAGSLGSGVPVPPLMDWPPSRKAWLVAALVWLSGLGSLAIVRPHAGIRRVHLLCAAVAAAAYVPLGWLVARVVEGAALQRWSQMSDLWVPAPDSTQWRVLACAVMLVVVTGLRGTTRLLVARSLALRTGRVDRQTMLAMAAALAIIIVGDLLGLWQQRLGPGGAGGPLATLGTVLMLAGGLLFSVGLVGAVADCLRIARVVIIPPLSLGQVLEPAPASAPRTPRPSARSGE